VRLPEFEYLKPESLEEVLDLLAEHGTEASLLAGGTDLLVRLKQRLVTPTHLISLKNISDLAFIREDEGTIKIGSMTPLSSILDSDLIRDHAPALHQAVRLIGAPPIQHFRGTIGGNLCLQTRCLHYNQSAFWRSGRTPCHKDNGETCYAEENSDRCRSANQSDGACALMALGASIQLRSQGGERSLPIEEFFTGKGEAPFDLGPDELVAEIWVPKHLEGEGSSFQKLTYRSAIDFALVSAAVKLKRKNGKITEARIVIGGAGASPLFLKEASALLIGKNVDDDDAFDKAIDRVIKHASAFMVDNLGSTVDYRRKMSGTMAKRALKETLEGMNG